MSFLNVLIPVETLSGLVQDIRRQVEAGRLEYMTGSQHEVDKPTRELERLVQATKCTNFTPVITLLTDSMDRRNLAAAVSSKSTSLIGAKLRTQAIRGMCFVYNAMRLEALYGQTWLGSLIWRTIRCLYVRKGILKPRAI
jgi:hypothetical protein